MRKGSKRNDWSTDDVRYLIENAGRIPRREICFHLKRSSESVKQKTKTLRAEGIPISLRCYRAKLEFCPSCGRLSGHLGTKGICEPCRRREQLDTINRRIAELLPRLTLEERDIYEKTEAETESRWDPLPKAPRTEGLSYYEKAKIEEHYALECEECTARNLRRKIKAVQKRKERIEKKINQ